MIAALFLFAGVLLVGYLGGAVPGLHPVFGVAIPYAAFLILVIGFIWRVMRWAKSPVPFRIPTTCGQQKSLDWVPHDKYENPDSTLRVIGRMLLEVLFFRSLFRNTKAEVRGGPKVAYGSSKWLWLFAILFHYSFLIIVLRHFRFFVEPTPLFAHWLADADGFMQIGLPALYVTDALIVLALSYLLLRRLFNPQVRYISLTADYFPVLLILGIALTGMAMRYLPWFRVDVARVKELSAGLVALQPTVPEGIGTPFWVHLFMVTTLMIYFPFSKLMHLGGVFLSPTRNLANNNRAVRHVNPWNPAVEVHEYDHWEEEFHDKIVAAGLPLDKPAEKEA
jgi:nitrate reductase gamma subunit